MPLNVWVYLRSIHAVDSERNTHNFTKKPVLIKILDRYLTTELTGLHNTRNCHQSVPDTATEAFYPFRA